MTMRYFTPHPITATPMVPPPDASAEGGSAPTAQALRAASGGGMGSGVGAVVSFLGVVRGDQQAGRRVTALTYDTYAEMAERQINQLVAAARVQWSLDAVRIEHRLGTVQVKEVSVMIVVTAQHRDEAYAASRFLIEGIKRDVPIWKREQYDDGTSQWVEGQRSGRVAQWPSDQVRTPHVVV